MVSRTYKKSSDEAGFTLIELMVVMAIIAVLASIAIPSFVATVKHAREAALRQDLATMRNAIDSFTYDKQKAPQDLSDIVQGWVPEGDSKGPLHPEQGHLDPRPVKQLHQHRRDPVRRY